MHAVILPALAAHFLLLISTGHVLAQDAGTTTTLTTTTTVFTSTTTITAGGNTYTSATTETVSLSSTLIRTAGVAATTTSTQAGSMSFEGDLQAAVLNSTNFFRGLHQASNLTWDDTLADYAKNYSKGCVWEHSVRLI